MTRAEMAERMLPFASSDRDVKSLLDFEAGEYPEDCVARMAQDARIHRELQHELGL